MEHSNKNQSFIVILLLIAVFMAPKTEAMVLFGGSINKITGCINSVIYTMLGPPFGGEYLWSPTVTTTYSFGPPRHSNQWLLGTAGPSYFCIVSILPLKVEPGLLMMMMGSSQ